MRTTKINLKKEFKKYSVSKKIIIKIGKESGYSGKEINSMITGNTRNRKKYKLKTLTRISTYLGIPINEIAPKKP